jgi:tRNA threonylcarbamoyladenosine biosynthesis protein TsaE
VNEYRSDTIAGPIYHFDFYRIRTTQEACDMGIEDYLICGAPCFIEWPEKIEALLPPDTLFVTIETQEDETHIVKMLCSRERS